MSQESRGRIFGFGAVVILVATMFRGQQMIRQYIHQEFTGYRQGGR